MNDNNSYIRSFEIGKPIYSDGVSEVVESKHPKFPVSVIVTGMVGWEEYTLIPAQNGLRILPGARESKIPLRCTSACWVCPG